ncbi:MAG: sugar nucleotide-binding protein [Chloroflexi bacterium]|nr:sugar nucleotide-binding protein [Chloroflexota bacterium]
MSRLLITGGSSYLGVHLVPPAAATHETLYTFFSQDPLGLPNGRYLDLRDGTAVTQLVGQFVPDVIIHTAGSNRGADMAAVIEQGAAHIAQAATAVGARLIHLSTDVVFSGRDAAPYDETAVPTPVNAYGRAKANAEATIATHPNHVIIRTSLIYGLARMDHGTAWMKKALQAGQPVTLFDNQIRNPVWVNTLTDACLELADHPYTGILNVAGSQVLTRAEYSLKLLNWWGVHERETLTIGPSLGGQWPLNCELDLRRATAVLTTPLDGIDDVCRRASPPAAGQKI